MPLYFSFWQIDHQKEMLAHISITVTPYHIPEWVLAISPLLPQTIFFLVHNLQPAKGTQNTVKIWELWLFVLTKTFEASGQKLFLNAVTTPQQTVQVT